jgi:CheY-like chemotaxis protein
LSRSPENVVAVTDDLTFRSRIEQSLAQAGIPVRFVAAHGLSESLRAARPTLALIDYGAYGGAASEALARVKADPSTADIPVLAFGPHLDRAGRDRAKASGADAVLSNAQVASDLPAFVRRWAGPRSEEAP